ncbi:unnamed protein product [Paramecium pentaurelia]|uniref:Uncharacterized protein n=1 Tax=Paramecium pentaurelia TaxID=43138 RepID=A0A8S1VKA5_9CILI|nr:unnamed protein product [Paramecium pentaurelia]
MERLKTCQQQQNVHKVYQKDQIDFLKSIKQQANTEQFQHINNQISNSQTYLKYLIFFMRQIINYFIYFNKLQLRYHHISIPHQLYILNSTNQNITSTNSTFRFNKLIKGFKNKQLLYDLELKTNRSKMISVILSISEFIRLMLTINSNDENNFTLIIGIGVRNRRGGQKKKLANLKA